MDDQPRTESDTADEVEVSDLRGRNSPDVARRPPLTRRQRMRRLAVAGGSVLLALVILVVGVPALREGAGSWLSGFIPTPTATLPPGADRYYFVASVADTRLAIDDRPVSLPRIGIDPPLALSRGQHRLSWRAAPFLPQSCLLSIPLSVNDECGTPAPLYTRQASVTAFVVLLRESFATLFPDEQNAAVRAIQRALNTPASDLQPGDHYFFHTATQPLRGTLNARLDVLNTPAADSACVPASRPPYVTCQLSANAGICICTIPASVMANIGVTVTPPSWYVAAFVTLSWTIATLSGQNLVTDSPISQGGLAVADFGIFIALTWDGAAWHTQPFLGRASEALIQRLNASGIFATSLLPTSFYPADLGCAAMPDFVGSTTAVQGAGAFTILAASSPANGCLAIESIPTASGTQQAEFLYRFGMLVAVNDIAHRQAPGWPAASAHERQVAAAILAAQ